MPRGVPKKLPQTERMKELLQARADLDARMVLERRRLRDLGALRKFLAKRPTLTRAELAKYVKDLPVAKARRADKPVATLQRRTKGKSANGHASHA